VQAFRPAVRTLIFSPVVAGTLKACTTPIRKTL
jgi:hypothetical protein